MSIALSLDGALLLIMILSYIWLCPFTKVEESFNMQAIHDLLHLSGSLDHAHGTNATSVLDLSDFDHLEFPGVVPRTFLGPIFLAAVSYPFQAILRTLFNKKIYSQYLIRVVMGLCSWLSFMAFRDSVSHRFGLRAGILTCTLASFQFHLPFYMSRTLPNTFALIGCLAAYSLWLRDRGLKALLVIAFFMITFRCDLLILLAPMTLQMLVCREVPFWTTALLGVGSAVIALLLTLSVDSFFWQRAVWPEGVVLFFNTVQNKSSEWGVMSWHWYLSSALPKSLHMCFPLAIVAVLGLRYPFKICGTAEPASSSPSERVFLPLSMRSVHFGDSNVLPSPSDDGTGDVDKGRIRDKRRMSKNMSDEKDEGKKKSAIAAGQAEAEAEAEIEVEEELEVVAASHTCSALRLRYQVVLGLLGSPDLVLLYYCLPSFSFVALYSILPHKELRFLFPAMPLFIMGAGVGLHKLLPSNLLTSTMREANPSTVITAAATPTVAPTPTLTPASSVSASSSEQQRAGMQLMDGRRRQSSAVVIKGAVDVLLRICFVFVLLLSFVLTGFTAYASHLNYPGGSALQTLLSLQSRGSSPSSPLSCSRVVRVHIDEAAAMTGVTRFGQEPFIHLKKGTIEEQGQGQGQGQEQEVLAIEYSKEERLTDFTAFHWLITGDPLGHGKLSGFEVVKEVSGFVSYSFRPPPSPSSSSSAAVSLSVHHIISGECLSGGECGQDAEEALSLQQSLQDLNMRSRKHHPLPFIGRYLPVWVITETALYIMRNKSNTQ